MQLSIPKTHKAAFLRFVRLSPQSMRSFLQMLKRAKPKLSLRSFAGQLTDSKIGLSHDVAYGIVRFLASLHRYRSETGIPLKTFLNDFIATAKAEAANLPELEKTSWIKVRQSISVILQGVQPLALTAKASELSTENQRRLCPLNCRILSDARPIFVGEPEEDPSAVLVQHVLKLAYHEEDDGVKEFYVTLDGDDVIYLQSMLFRAEKKERSIKRFVGKTGVPVLSEMDAK